MILSQLVLTGAVIGTIVGNACADLTRTHVFNRVWPPHARFHNAAGLGTVTGTQLLGLWLVWHPATTPAERKLAITTAALLPVIAWTPFYAALATPGTAVEDETGHLPRVAGIPLNLIPAAVVPVISAIG